jgi:anthranilate phosphoribosyltransferase
LDSVCGGSAQENAATIQKLFGGKSGPRRDIVVVNAAAALVAANVAPNFLEGARLAGASLDSGAAKEKLAALVNFTQLPE